MWRIFNKKNRTYTIGGVLAFVVIVFVVYKYVLAGTAFGKTLAGLMGGGPTVLGSSGWEKATYKGPHFTTVQRSGKIVIAEGGTGRSVGEAISLTAN